MNKLLIDFIKEKKDSAQDDYDDCDDHNCYFAGDSNGRREMCHNILRAIEHLKTHDNLDDFEYEV